jgi:hypothetical protein
MLTGIIDPVTERLDAFLRDQGARLVKEVAALSIALRSPGVVSLPPAEEAAARLQANLSTLMHEIETLCARHERAGFLTLFRKMPHGLAADVLSGAPGGRDRDSSLGVIFPEAVLFGTNCILKLASGPPRIRSNRDRYRFAPAEVEIEDAARLFLLCVIHRHELFCMNTVIRRELVEPASLDRLLTTYNARLGKQWSPRPARSASDLIVFAGSVHPLAPRERRWSAGGAGGRRELRMRNYHPVPCDAAAELARFAYLDTPDFERWTGVSFPTFWRVWRGLNRVLLDTLPVLWPEERLRAVSPRVLHAKLEQADDYCEAALGGGYPESIWRSCHEVLAREGAPHPSPSECRQVVEWLTYREIAGDVRFIEQPFVFYPVGSKLLMWDYFRHAGLLRCLARILTRRAGSYATQNEKGLVFERAVTSAVSAHAGVRGARKWIHRVGGRDVWDVDVGFVCRGILFLVDAKNEQKSVRYYFEGVEVADKVIRREQFLRKLDDNAVKYADAVRGAWQDAGPIRGAIPVVCTAEAEFIASDDARAWLSPHDCPRVCLMSELVELLDDPELERKVESNPAFVRFADGDA